MIRAPCVACAFAIGSAAAAAATPSSSLWCQPIQRWNTHGTRRVEIICDLPLPLSRLNSELEARKCASGANTHYALYYSSKILAYMYQTSYTNTSPLHIHNVIRHACSLWDMLAWHYAPLFIYKDLANFNELNTDTNYTCNKRSIFSIQPRDTHANVCGAPHHNHQHRRRHHHHITLLGVVVIAHANCTHILCSTGGGTMRKIGNRACDSSSLGIF